MSRALSWIGRLLIVGAVAVVALLSPLSSGERTLDTASISTYDASMRLTEHGTLVTDERIVVDMPPGKRGIFRIFDTADPRRAGVDHPVTDVQVERDGHAEPYIWVDSAHGTETLRIGQESTYLEPGEHTYRIRSTTTDVLEPGTDGETLFWWDVVGAGWQMAMGSAHVRVELPTEPLRAECVMGKDTPCTASVEGRSLTVTTGPLEPFTPVTVRVAFPADALPAPPAGESPVPTVVLSAIAAAVAVGLGIYLFRATREVTPGFPVLFEPPPGITPAVGARVLHEQHSRDDLQATFYTLAERGILRLEGDDDEWRLQLLADRSASQLHAPEAAVLGALGLFAPGETFTVSQSPTSGERVSKARSALRSSVDADASQYLRTSGAGIAAMVLGWISAVGVVVIAGAYLFSNVGWKPWPLLIGLAAFALVSMGMMFDPGVVTKRTGPGRDLWSRTGGFARFLTTDSAESRFDAAKHLDWYPRYLPWALVLGSADAWARRFESQGVATPPVPWIIWSGQGMYSADRMSSSFNSAITSAAAAYAATQVSSSGGGFSGGSGGGGGGGGSW